MRPWGYRPWPPTPRRPARPPAAPPPSSSSCPSGPRPSFGRPTSRPVTCSLSSSPSLLSLTGKVTTEASTKLPGPLDGLSEIYHEREDEDGSRSLVFFEFFRGEDDPPPSAQSS